MKIFGFFLFAIALYTALFLMANLYWQHKYPCNRVTTAEQAKKAIMTAVNRRPWTFPRIMRVNDLNKQIKNIKLRGTRKGRPDGPLKVSFEIDTGCGKTFSTQAHIHKCGKVISFQDWWGDVCEKPDRRPRKFEKNCHPLDSIERAKIKIVQNLQTYERSVLKRLKIKNPGKHIEKIEIKRDAGFTLDPPELQFVHFYLENTACGQPVFSEATFNTCGAIYGVKVNDRQCSMIEKLK